MEKVNFKLIKVLVLSILSFLFYFGINNSSKINSMLIRIQKSNSSRGFGIYLTINLFKYFLLIFGIVSFLVVLFKFLNKKENS